MNLSEPWAVLVSSLASRPMPTLDELRDSHNREVKRERMTRMAEGRTKQAIEQIATTEQAIYALVKKERHVPLSEMHEKLNLTEHHLRQVCNRMTEDGRLQVVTGSYGKKYWRIK